MPDRTPAPRPMARRRRMVIPWKLSPAAARR
jgi:hypothetical protein